MKKTLLTFAAMLATCGAMADEWVKPMYSGAYQPLTEGDTVYVYNIDSKQFLTEGNDWGTHASVGDTGLLFTVEKYQMANEDGTLQEWDGKTYQIKDYSIAKGGWKNMFITDGGGVYMDRGEQADFLFSFEDKGNYTYYIYGAEANPIWNASGDKAGYVLGHDALFVNNRDGITTGTGVVYNYFGEDNEYEPGQFNATWAFVSRADYAGYQDKIAAYAKAVELKALIDEAKDFGVDAAEAEKAYANTSSTADELKAAIDALNAKILAYYETSVTPDSPKDLTSMIANAECNSVDGWANNIGATTWNTQTWIDEGWTGFEGTTLNIWGSPLEGNVSQKFTGLPNGIYVVSVALFSEKADAFAYANENTKLVASGAVGKSYQITTEVTNGELEFGVKTATAAENWIAMDNVSVMYYGSGVEAYRYWLNGLLESAPSFDDAIVQDKLVAQYEEVLASVNTAKTKEEILGIIPAYEAILEEITTNIEAYNSLKDAISAAEELGLTANSYYGNQISDFVQENAQPAIEEHALDTEGVKSVIAELKVITDETQEYVWNIEKLIAEIGKAEVIFAEHESSCSLEAAESYKTFMTDYSSMNMDEKTNADILNLLDQLYNIEFNLQVPVDPASDENPIDYTAKIFNPTFIGVEGWTNDGWSTFGNNDWYGFANEEGASSGDGNYLNIWNKGNARGYQQLTGLPAGAYTLQFGAYADKAGLQIYANDNIRDIEVGQSDYGYMRLYTIDVIIGEEGTLEIGVRNTNEDEMWAMVDEMHLFYKGTESEIMTGIKTPGAINGKPGIYSVNGIKRNALGKGINIIKNADGTVTKVMK